MTMVFVTIDKINKDSFLLSIFSDMLPNHRSQFWSCEKRNSIFCAPDKMDIDFYKGHKSLLFIKTNNSLKLLVLINKLNDYPFKFYSTTNFAFSPPIKISKSPGSTTLLLFAFINDNSSLDNVKFTVLVSPGFRLIFSKPFNLFTSGV